MTRYEMSQVTGAYMALISSAAADDLDQDQDLDLKVKLKDQDQDQDHDQDQGQNVETRFRDLARKFGIDLDEVELSTIERNMFWFVNNFDTIRYPAAYIRKMIRDCGVRKRVGFQLPEQRSEVKEDSVVTDIYGYPVEDLDGMIPYFDYSTYTAIMDVLPASSRILFRSFEELRSSRVKMRVLLAEGKKRGVI